MNVSELKAMNLSELKDKLAEVQKSQFDLRMAKGNGQLTKNHLLKDVRRDIAQVKTIIKQHMNSVSEVQEAGNK